MKTRVVSPVSFVRSSVAGIVFAIAVAGLVVLAGRTEARGEGFLAGSAGGEAIHADLALGLGLSQGGDLQHLDLLAQQAPQPEQVVPATKARIRSAARDEVVDAPAEGDIDGELFPRSRSVVPLLVSAGTGADAPAAATIVPTRPGSIQPVGVQFSRFRSALPVGTPPADRLFRSIR